MKKFLLFFVISISASAIVQNVFSQKIFSDKKDPFTNLRAIATTISPLYRVGVTNILQVQTSMIILNDSIISCSLGFLVPEIPIKIDKVDTTQKDICLLKDEFGNIFTGKVSSVVSAVGYSAFTCNFSKDDFLKLTESTISDVKITTISGKGGLFSVDKKWRDNIAK